MNSPWTNIDAVHVSEPGLLVLDITAADEATARRALDQLNALWATDASGRIRRLPAQPGVQCRVYAHLDHDPASSA
ncbi:DUF6207 family protein [Streptomyces sp. NPDC058685]|uniref:DUF6207 family protein n=1 Tax=Streptomyces sp. NPDC058685 TaxID=3346598 RepID=UPI00364A6A63